MKNIKVNNLFHRYGCICLHVKTKFPQRKNHCLNLIFLSNIHLYTACTHTCMYILIQINKFKLILLCRRSLAEEIVSCCILKTATYSQLVELRLIKLHFLHLYPFPWHFEKKVIKLLTYTSVSCSLLVLLKLFSAVP